MGRRLGPLGEPARQGAPGMGEPGQPCPRLPGGCHLEGDHAELRGRPGRAGHPRRFPGGQPWHRSGPAGPQDRAGGQRLRVVCPSSPPYQQQRNRKVPPGHVAPQPRSDNDFLPQDSHSLARLSHLRIFYCRLCENMICTHAGRFEAIQTWVASDYLAMTKYKEGE